MLKKLLCHFFQSGLVSICELIAQKVCFEELFIKKKIDIMPLVYHLAYGVKTILTNGPDEESAVGIFLSLALLVSGTNPCK